MERNGRPRKSIPGRYRHRICSVRRAARPGQCVRLTDALPNIQRFLGEESVHNPNLKRPQTGTDTTQKYHERRVQISNVTEATQHRVLWQHGTPTSEACGDETPDAAPPMCTPPRHAAPISHAPIRTLRAHVYCSTAFPRVTDPHAHTMTPCMLSRLGHWTSRGILAWTPGGQEAAGGDNHPLATCDNDTETNFVLGVDRCLHGLCGLDADTSTRSMESDNIAHSGATVLTMSARG